MLNNINKLLLTSCGLLVIFNNVCAEEPAPALSLNDIQATALAENRDLHAARLVIQAAEGRLRQAGLWPNPELELARTSDRTFNNEGEYAASVEFNQKFPISGRISRASNVARVDVALAVAEVRNQERLLLGEVLTNARQFLVIDQKLKINEESQVIIKNLIKASENRLKQAEVSPTDVNLERIELQKLSLRSAALGIERERTRIALNTFLGRSPEELIAVSGTAEVDTNVLDFSSPVVEAIARRPDRQMAALQIDRAAAEIKLARAERLEDWTVGFGYDRDVSKFDSSLIENQKDAFLGVRLTIPLPLWNRNQGGIAETSAMRAVSKAQLASLELKISSEIESARVEVKQLLPVIQQYKQSLTLAVENSSLVHRGYLDGLVPISAVIQAQQQLVDLRESYTDSLEAFAKAATDLETALASNPLLQRSSK